VVQHGLLHLISHLMELQPQLLPHGTGIPPTRPTLANLNSSMVVRMASQDLAASAVAAAVSAAVLLALETASGWMVSTLQAQPTPV
jgi:hypothetical protein